MTAIIEIKGREILDSRGNPTVEVDVTLEPGAFGRAAVPPAAPPATHAPVDPRAAAPIDPGLDVDRQAGDRRRPLLDSGAPVQIEQKDRRVGRVVDGQRDEEFGVDLERPLDENPRHRERAEPQRQQLLGVRRRQIG